MTTEERVQAVLEADSPLSALATGGVYTFTALGRRGFVPKNPVCASAWTTTNGLAVCEPSIIIRDRTEAPDGERYDAVSGEASTEGVLELWIYDQDSHATINNIADQAWRLLHGKIFAETGLVRNVQMLKGLYAPEFDNVALRRDDFSYKRIKRVT